MASGKSQTKNITAENQLTETDILQYLSQHPDFLVRHSPFLKRLEQTADSQTTQLVDLSLVLTQKLRSEKNRIKHQKEAALSTYRQNIDLVERVEAASLYLLQKQTLDEFTQAVLYDLPLLLEIDKISLGVEMDPLSSLGNLPKEILHFGHGAIDRWVGEGADLTISTGQQARPEIFGADCPFQDSLLIRVLVDGIDHPFLIGFAHHHGQDFQTDRQLDQFLFLTSVIEKHFEKWLMQE